MGIIEEDISQVESVSSFVFQGIQAGWFLESAILVGLMGEHVKELKKHEPRQLLIVKPVPPNCLVNPHRRRLVKAVWQGQ